MAKHAVNHIKLGVFVLGGLLFLVLLLYMIGKNRNLFGATYTLKARFENVQGLVPGNNVRFSGIEAGTVKRVQILSDTLIEVTMIIEKKMLNIIRKNAIVSIGTEGFVGNKVVNIVPARQPAALAVPGDVLASRKSIDTDDMLQTLNKTNSNIAFISEELRTTVLRINNSASLWALLNDNTVPADIKTSVAQIRRATGKASEMADNLNLIVSKVKNGEGSLGSILTDTLFAKNLNEAMLKIKSVGDEADSLAFEINKVVQNIDQDINSGKGPLNAMLKDSTLVLKLNASLDNIQKGTDNFNQNMEALKHNILFRGYFKKLEKEKNKTLRQSTSSANK